MPTPNTEKSYLIPSV